MARPVTLFTGQWTDLKLQVLAEKARGFGYDGLELACWGDHFDVREAAKSTKYCESRRGLLEEHGLKVWAISNHLAGQAVCDRIDRRHKAILPPHIWGNGVPEGVRRRASEEMKLTARAAAKFEVDVVVGFTGSSIWHLFYPFPPNDQKDIDKGYTDFARLWIPILKEFEDVGVRFSLEVHPTEIAFDVETYGLALDALDGHDSRFKINFDPSHLVWQGIDPVALIKAYPEKIAHVHFKDARVGLDGTNSILGGHLPFGHVRRGWDFCSIGRGDVNFKAIVTALNSIGYAGPISIEWEDPTMDRAFGAAEAIGKVQEWLYPPAGQAFDAAFSERA